ncbi:ATP dependent DNA ligase [Leptothrix cholodnii SP-6]|uniref:ATP dependent DNA ligase n=1 Tax=Leptothrix cholodnii (strain ATCC 51168 / LMG 8142 / SP-6) TaxID=395495 RepID=B1Y8A7_LEPCP|nr:DNA ligase [Leptothrix cholodnii]ACB34977.1 ATP dependent DNA ligase [Leptothrix cholodnii SP-6]
MDTRPDRRRWLAWGLAQAWAVPMAGALGSLGLRHDSARAEPLAPVPPALLLARPAGPDLDVSSHLVSEKLDGVRAFWSGRQLLLRSGIPIRAPADFTARLPTRALDGELWLGRSRFDAMSALIRREHSADDPLWREVRYAVFELPDAPGDFAQRHRAMRELLPGTDAVAGAHVVQQRRLDDRQELDRWLAEVIAAGGEGLMLHRADAPYVTGRSDWLLKLKPQLDAEAMVIGHLPGKGRHAGRLGALRVRTPDGREFALGSGLSDAERDDPPAPGRWVTYRYRGLTNSGLPRFATFWRMHDLP